MSGTTGTAKSTSNLLTEFRDGQADGAITAQYVRDVVVSSLNVFPTTVTAGGTTQGNATQLSMQVNIVTTCPSGAGVGITGGFTRITNATAVACLVYPPSGAKFGTLATNTPVSLPAGLSCTVCMVSTTQGYVTGESALAAGQGGQSGSTRNVLTGAFIHDLTNQKTNLASFVNYVGKTPDFLLAFTDGQPDWSHLANIGWATGYMQPTGLPVCWSFPMLPNNGDRLDLSASGSQNSYYTTAAQVFAAYPFKLPDGTQLIRIGWEFPSGYPWQVQVVSQNTPQNYINTWINIVNSFRAVSSEFRFVWCSNSGSQLYGNGSPGLCYPGDSYVDFIGTDAYQHAEFSLDTFAKQLAQNGWGIQWAYDFSQCLNGLRTGTPKPFIIGEWGVVNGTHSGTDTQGAQYIHDQWDWMRGTDIGSVVRNLGFTCFWDGDAGSSYDSLLDDNSKPLSGTAWKATFGGTDLVYDPNATGTFPSVTAHRYWRLLFHTTAANPFSMAEVQFRTTVGTSLAFSGGTASASSNFNNTDTPPNLASDGNANTFWAASSLADGEWWKYDYGSGVTKGIVQIAITSRNDAFFPETPLTFGVQSSDDNSTWTTVWNCTATTWTQAQTQVFTRPGS